MRALALIAGGLAWAGAAAAQPAGAAPAVPVAANPNPDAETMAAALALVDQDDIEKRMTAAGLLSADAAMQTEIEAFRKKGLKLPPELLDQIRQLVLSESNAMLQDMAKTIRADAALIYARYFTAAELRELKELQSHPVMRKMQAMTPQLSAELGRIGMAKAAERGPDLERKVQALVEKWFADHAAQARPAS